MTKSKRGVAHSLQKKLPFLAGLALFATLSGASSGLTRSFEPNQAGPPEPRTARIIPFPRMPANTTVSIKAIRNLQSTNWLQDLELEVQNNSRKPIYFLELLLLFPDLPSRSVDGAVRKDAISLTYGKWSLMNSGEFATAEDVPIEPGETLVFRIPESHWKGFEFALAEMGLPKSFVRNIEVRTHKISFGDGSGYKLGGPFQYGENGSNTSKARDRPNPNTRSYALSKHVSND